MKVKKVASGRRPRKSDRSASSKLVRDPEVRPPGILQLAGSIDYDPNYDYKAERRKPRG